MPRLLARLAASPRTRQRAHLIGVALFGIVAAFSWWIVKEEGATPARVLTAIASTAVVLLELFLPKRRRLLRRSRSEPGSE